MANCAHPAARIGRHLAWTWAYGLGAAGCGAAGSELATKAAAAMGEPAGEVGAEQAEGARLSPNGPGAEASSGTDKGGPGQAADALPTGPVSTLEVPAPGQVSPPPGGSTQAPQTEVNPQCPSMLKAAMVQDCNQVDVAYSAKHAAYCDYMRNPTPGSEGGSVPFDDLAALESLARVGSQCCRMNTSGAKKCGG